MVEHLEARVARLEALVFGEAEVEPDVEAKAEEEQASDEEGEECKGAETWVQTGQRRSTLRARLDRLHHSLRQKAAGSDLTPLLVDLERTVSKLVNLSMAASARAGATAAERERTLLASILAHADDLARYAKQLSAVQTLAKEVLDGGEHRLPVEQEGGRRRLRAAESAVDTLAADAQAATRRADRLLDEYSATCVELSRKFAVWDELVERQEQRQRDGRDQEQQHVAP